LLLVTSINNSVRAYPRSDIRFGRTYDLLLAVSLSSGVSGYSRRGFCFGKTPDLLLATSLSSSGAGYIQEEGFASENPLTRYFFFTCNARYLRRNPVFQERAMTSFVSVFAKKTQSQAMKSSPRDALKNKVLERSRQLR
jgi:hypothetical protein